MGGTAADSHGFPCAARNCNRSCVDTHPVFHRSSRLLSQRLAGPGAGSSRTDKRRRAIPGSAGGGGKSAAYGIDTRKTAVHLNEPRGVALRHRGEEQETWEQGRGRKRSAPSCQPLAVARFGIRTIVDPKLPTFHLVLPLLSFHTSLPALSM